MAKPAEARTKRFKALQARVEAARDFPSNTCPASRHVHLMADALADGNVYHMFADEPAHAAVSLYSVLASLWEARSELAALKATSAPDAPTGQ